MRRGKRNSPDFGLSFLDVMSCGFGATILLLLIVDHKTDLGGADSPKWAEQTAIGLNIIKEESEKSLAALRAALAAQQEQNEIELDESEALAEEATELAEEITTTEDAISSIQGEIVKLKSQLEKQMRTPEDKEEPSRYITRKGRQSLSGLKLNGKRMLILFDVSASMLDETLVNVIRRRNMSDARKRASPKWQRSLLILDWIGSQLQQSQLFQIHTFNTAVTPAIEGSEVSGWESYGSGQTYATATANVKQLIPSGGTNLYAAFRILRNIKPKPDNIILITDSLPTQGVSASTRNTVTGKERMTHFIKAFSILPSRIPVNVILLPFEGDPDAAGAFWRLASRNNGAFIVPSPDWP